MIGLEVDFVCLDWGDIMEMEFYIVLVVRRVGKFEESKGCKFFLGKVLWVEVVLVWEGGFFLK